MMRSIHRSEGTQRAFFENKSSTESIDHLLTKQQLAQQLALSRSYISNLMSQEGLPYFKIGRAVRFRPKEVVEWLQKRKMP